MSLKLKMIGHNSGKEYDFETELEKEYGANGQALT
jgi:hypothetical protein